MLLLLIALLKKVAFAALLLLSLSLSVSDESYVFRVHMTVAHIFVNCIKVDRCTQEQCHSETKSNSTQPLKVSMIVLVAAASSAAPARSAKCTSPSPPASAAPAKTASTATASATSAAAAASEAAATSEASPIVHVLSVFDNKLRQLFTQL